MKNNTITILFMLFIAFTSNAQTIDTVSIGGNYEGQVWYNLDDGTQTSIDNTSWDFAFQINGTASSILANTNFGAELYRYPNGDTADWSTLDTAGIDQWESWFNSAHTWNEGAFNKGIDTTNDFDLGWGTYNMLSHHTVGDSLFVWKTANGDIYKIWIQRLAGGVYDFLVADYNENNIDTVALDKKNFANKDFGYYSISQNSTLDLEPKNSEWDLVIGKYIEDLGIPYSVTGIRTQKDLEAVKVYPVDDVDAYDSVDIHTYSSDINVIGYDWKSYDYNNATYEIQDSTVYFIKKDNNTYWKLVMKGFGGSTDGNFIFEKTKITVSTGLTENTLNQGTFTIYPNPTIDGRVSIISDLPTSVQKATIDILSINGQIVQSEQLQVNNSFEAHNIQLRNLSKGVYFIRLSHESGMITKKLIVK